MNTINFIHQFKIFSREGKIKPASKSEIARWATAGNIIINNKQVGPNDDIEFPVTSCILFPKGKRITLK